MRNPLERDCSNGGPIIALPELKEKRGGGGGGGETLVPR